MLKRTVLSARSGGFTFKKRRFLKRIRIFVYLKIIYLADYQHLVYNAKNKRFSLSNDNAPANINCMYGQNSLFVDFIHYTRKCMRRRKKRNGEILLTKRQHCNLLCQVRLKNSLNAYLHSWA